MFKNTEINIVVAFAESAEIPWAIYWQCIPELFFGFIRPVLSLPYQHMSDVSVK